jgi:hypothetical protein
MGYYGKVFMARFSNESPLLDGEAEATAFNKGVPAAGGLRRPWPCVRLARSAASGLTRTAHSRHILGGGQSLWLALLPAQNVGNTRNVIRHSRPTGWKMVKIGGKDVWKSRR